MYQGIHYGRYRRRDSARHSRRPPREPPHTRRVQAITNGGSSTHQSHKFISAEKLEGPHLLVSSSTLALQSL